MKEKIKRISSSTWALILALMMVVSSFSVLAATTNVNKTSAGASGGTISQGEILYYDFSSLTKQGVNFWDGKITSYSKDFSGTCDNGTWLDNKVLAVTVQADIPFYSGNGRVIAQAAQDNWTTKLTASQVPSDGQNCIKISVNSDGTLSYSWSTYDGGSTTTGHELYLFGHYNNTVGNIWYNPTSGNKFTYSDGKYTLSNITFDPVSNDAAYFRFYDATEKVYYQASKGDLEVSNDIPYSFSSNNDNAFKYALTSEVKVNIELDLSSKEFKITSADTPTETTPTVTTPVGGGSYFLYNGSTSFNTSSLLGEFSGGTLSVDLTAGTTYSLFVHDSNGKNYFHENKTFDDTNKSYQLYPYGEDKFNHAITFVPTTTAKYKFTWTISGNDYFLSYEMETEDVAGNVVLRTNATDNKISYGTDLSVTASLAEPKASTFTYKFYLDDSTNPTATFTSVTDNSYTYTFSDLTEGKHTIKVEVSSDGYNTVSATTTVTVVKDDVATELQLSANRSSINYGDTVTLSASVESKVGGEITYTFEEVNGDSSTEFTPIKKSESNAGYVVSGLSVGEHVFRVTVSADNYNSVVSNTVTVTVNPINITSKVTLTGPNPGCVYNVGDSIKLEASCEKAPEGVNVKYNYYINGKKINGSATPNIVTYKFTASDVGTITFYAEAVADNYNTVKSAEISASVIMKQVATSVKLTATPTDVKFGNEVTITAELQGEIQPGNFTYTFRETNAKGDIQSVQSVDGSATIVTSKLGIGRHRISVEVSGTNFQSITSTEDLIVTVSDAYYDEDVNATSGKTMIISYDATSNVRNSAHVWYKDTADHVLFDGNDDTGGMTAVPSIAGLYYKDLSSIDSKLGSNYIRFLVKDGKGWDGKKHQSDDVDNKDFVAGVQWSIYAKDNDKTHDINNIYSPLTFTKLNVPTEINDDNSTKFVFTVGGGLPNFFKNVVKSTTIKPEYTVTITDPDGKVVDTASSNETAITLDRLTLTKDGKYTFTVTDGIDTVSYIKDITVTPLVVKNYKATVNSSDNAKISVTYKDTTIAGGSIGELPEKRNAIISVTDIKEGYKVKSVFVKSGTTEIPVTSQGNNQYLFTMPSSDVTITVDVVAKSQYAVNFGVSDKTNGSITAKTGSTSINSGERITEDTEVTFTVTTKSSDYVIDGWYSDASYENKIKDVDTSATTYTTTISETTDVYVKISKKPGELQENMYFLYGIGNSKDNPSTWDNSLPVYKKTDGSYYVKFDISSISKDNYYYALSSKSVGNVKEPNDLYWQKETDDVKFDCTDTSVIHNNIKSGGYGYEGEYKYRNYGIMQFKDTSLLTGLTFKITPQYDKDGVTTVGARYTAIPTVKTAPEGALEVYAKDGTLNTTSGYGDTTVSGMNADCEGFEVDNGNYKQYAAMPGDRLTITTVVNDTQAAQGWYVSNYVINGVGYDAISTVKALALAQAGSTGASYTIATPYSVTGKETKNIIEITPIYKNRNIEAANDYITLYANADSLGDAWGNTISVYAYYYKKSGSTEAYCMNSAYPGDPMMKTSSGLFVSYVPKHYWQASGSKMIKQTNTVSGVTFNNYAEKETVHQKVLEGKQLQNNQTYDYDDFKLIADAGYDTVLYDFKYYNNQTTNQSTLVNNGNTYDTLNPLDKIDPSDYADTSHNGWEVLTNMDNEEVSLLGYSARNASTNGNTFDNTNRLHIVSVGNINTTMGKWSTVWFVYDKENNFITKGIPSDFIPRYTKDKDNKQVESETQTAAYKAIKDKQLEYTGAYITYESEMGPGTSTDPSNTGNRSDGRWYYSRAVEQVKVNTHVLYADATDSASWTEDNYGNDYAGTFTGAKALVGTERTTSVDRNSEVSISATALSKGTAPKQYKFIGWTANATKGEDGTYTIVKNPSMTDSAQTVKVSTNMDLYALYIPVAEGDLIITHEKYTGKGAFGGPGRYFVQAKLYERDNVTVKHTYYQEGSVTIPGYTENSGKIVVQLIVYSVNGSRYKATYNYQNTAITDDNHVDKVCSSSDPAVVEKEITPSNIFDPNTGKMKTSKVDFYSDLQTNNITVKMNYYNRKVENGKPADMDSTPTSYSYRFTSYPSEVLKDDGTLISIQKLIEYAKNHSQQPDNMIEKYVSWNSQKAAKTGITSYMNYHENAKYKETPFHTDQYGKVQTSGEKWVTYYDRNGVEVTEDKATAGTVSSISIWYFNTPKKYTYTLNTANSSDQLGGNGPYYGTHTQTVSGLFYNTRLFGPDSDVSDAASDYTKGYGINEGYTNDKIVTAKTIEKDGTTLKFLYWAYDTAGKKIASTNIQYGLRITNNTTLYAIYGENKITAPGLTVQEVTPDTFFDSNNISKTRINTIFNPYNCKDNDKNIDSASVVYLRVSNATTEKSLNNLDDADLQELRKQISNVVSKASYEKFKSGVVDPKASQQIVNISGSTASGFKFKIVAPSSSSTESSTELQTSLSNKNRGQFTTTFTTSILKNYTYYVFATMGYRNYKGNDKSVVPKDGISYITSDNFVKYAFDKDGKYIAPSNS